MQGGVVIASVRPDIWVALAQRPQPHALLPTYYQVIQNKIKNIQVQKKILIYIVF